jgi:APA family basic amino acid/polyamine antiporter
MRRRAPDAPRSFRTPLAPLVGTVAIGGCIYLFFSLPSRTELFFLGWNVLGLVVYFIYGRPRAGRATTQAEAA